MRRLLLPSLVTALLAMAVPACHNYYDTGLEAFTQGNLDEAEREAREGLDEDARDPSLNLLLARVLVRREAWAEARPYAERAVEGLPEEAEAQYTFGIVQKEVGSRISAGRHLIKAWRLDAGRFSKGAPMLVELLPGAIDEARENDVPDAAVEFILALRELEPGHAATTEDRLIEAREAWGNKLQRLGRFSDAAGYYAELAGLYPDRAAYILEEGSIRLSLQEDDKASALFERYATAVTGKDAAARMDEIANRAHIRRRDDVAEAWWKRSFATDPSRHRAYLQLAAIQLEQLRAEEGYATLRAFLGSFKDEGKDPEPWLQAARAAVDANRGDLAIELLTEASTTANPSFVITDRLADLLLRRGRRGDMEDALKAYIDRSAAGKDAAAGRAAEVEVAQWLQRNKEWDAAAYWFRKVVDAGGEPHHWLALARVYSAAQRRSDMVDALLSYLKAAPGVPSDFITTASIMVAEGQYADAEGVITQGLKKHKGNDELTRFLAKVHYESGYLDKEEHVWRDWIRVQKEPRRASLEIGQMYARRADAPRAAAMLTEAAKDPALAPNALLALGDMYRERGMDREMREAYDRVVATSEDKAAALETLFGRYRGREFAEDALRVLDQLIALKPDDPSLTWEAGRKAVQLGDFARGMTLFRDHIAHSKDALGTTRKIGRFLQTSGQVQLALELYEDALRTANDKPELFGDIGDLYWELAESYQRTNKLRAAQMFDEARRFFARYIDGFPASDKQKPRELTEFGGRMASNRYRQFGLAVMAFERAEAQGTRLRPNDQFAYGESLLHQGKTERADAAFKAHIADSKPQAPRNFAVGEVCFMAGSYDLALKYLQRVLDKNAEAYVPRAFEVMTTILISTGKRERIEPLVLRYLELSRATQQSRILAAQVYEAAGLWPQALREYNDLLRLRPNNPETLRRVAEVSYKTGDLAATEALFAQTAKSSSNPAAAWEAIGDFYVDHGEITRGLDAYDKAIATGSASANAHIRRGTLLLLQGDRGRALDDLEQGLADADSPDQAYQTALETMLVTPFYDESKKLAQDALVRIASPEFFQRALAELEMMRGDHARAMADANAWGQARSDLSGQIALMRQYDYNLEIVDLFRNQVEVGDNLRTEQLIFENRANLDVLVEQIGVDRLPVIYRPLFTRRDDPAPLHKDIGLMYTQLDRPREAIVNLASASTRQGSDSDIILGTLYMQRGDANAARTAFVRYTNLFAEQPADYLAATRRVVSAYTLDNRQDDAERFVRARMAEPGLETLLVPVLVEHLLIAGRNEDALNLLHAGPLGRLFEPAAADQTVDVARLADLLEGARVLAGFGYGAEATQLLADIARARPDQAPLLLELVELGARHKHPDTASWADRYVALAQNIPEEIRLRKLRLADAYLAADDVAAARPMLDELLAAPDRAVSQRALDRLLALAYRTGDTKLLNDILARHLAAQGGTSVALLDEAQLLRKLGLVTLARDRYERAIALAPGDASNYTALLQTSHLAGGTDAIMDAHARYRRVATTSFLNDLELGRDLARSPDSDAALAWWSQLLKTHPMVTEANLEVARLLLLRGDNKAGRERLDTFLAASDNHPIAVEQALDLLVQLQRYDDVLQLLDRTAEPPAPKAEADTPHRRRGVVAARTPRTYLLAGVALYASGKREAALTQLDRYVEVAPDPLTAHLDVANAIRRCEPAGQDREATLRDALSFTERAMAAAQDSAAPYIVRAYLRMALGDKAGALADVETFLSRGDLDHVRGVATLARRLLEAGALPEAEQLLLKLAHNPALAIGEGVAIALRAYQEAGRFKEGLNFLRTHFPTLAAVPHAHVNVLNAAADLFAGTGDIDRAVSLFDEGLQRFPDDTVLLNNLAYILAQSGRDLPRAENLARRALTGSQLSSHTQGTYLDTLAWIHRKQGKNAEALQEQLLALRLSSDTAGDTVVLYVHLADIYDALGNKAQADEARRRARVNEAYPTPGGLR